MKKSKLVIFFMPVFIVLFLILGIIIFPNESIASAKEGLNIWTNVLIPSLLPFIIGANLIVDLKIVDLIGFIINPVTRFIFNVSGKGALVFVISTISGYPVGAKLASELRSNDQISKSEAQRLVSFCSTSGPLFIIGAVATGMFQNSSLGYLMITCHYLASISVGLFFRNHGKELIPRSSHSLREDIQNVINARYSNNEGFFVLFGNAIFNAVNTLLMIGGFVIVFSVIFKILSLFKIIFLLSYILYIPLSLFGVTKELCYAFISGLFEITIGCNKIAAVISTPEVLRATLASFLIGFSGLSILAQCCNFLAKTDINVGLYIFSKFLHGTLAGLFTFLLYPLFKSTILVSNFSSAYNVLYNNSIWNYYIENYKLILPILIIIYILVSLIFLEKTSYKIKNPS
ncbi:sporulation integral membrane protein YlbJ [Romboutsia sp.]|uniref:sporulation integral membrane protein YlbJ n=1 Tax=Romboutsia sp. TaxID=1965302 RepID=UPI002C1A9E23|nr:sporulation integral membrane protein YlbJ [Romboutsia sp.]HSQ87754.1 sporulation integral membrane protein YlbJ [Romboutsia sp.]